MGCGSSRPDFFALDTLGTGTLCSLCGQKIAGNHPRQKDPETDLYQHKACCAIVDAAAANQANAEAKRAEGERNSALETHLYSILGLKPVADDVTRYVSALRAGGYDTPEDLDEMTVEDLAGKPFNFKKMHIQKVRDSLEVSCAHAHRNPLCVCIRDALSHIVWLCCQLFTPLQLSTILSVFFIWWGVVDFIGDSITR